MKARKIAQDELNKSLAEQAVQLEIDAKELKKLEELVKSGLPYEKAHAQAIKESSVAAKEHAVETKGAAGSTDVFVEKQKQAQTQLKATTTASKAATVAMKALNVALNVGVMLFASWALPKLFDFFDSLITTSKEIEESANKAKEAIASINSELDNLKDTTNEIKDRYAELAQGVNQLNGQNLTLSTEDYEEFIDLSNQLAELFPELVKGYDENGNAILDLSGNVNTIVLSLNDLIKAEKELANQQILEEMPDVYKGFSQNIDKATNALQTNKERLEDWSDIDLSNFQLDEMVLDEYKLSIDIDPTINPDVVKKLNDIFNNIGLNNGDVWYDSSEVDKIVFRMIPEAYERIISDEQIMKNLSKLYNDYANELSSAINKANDDLESEYANFNSTLINNVLSTDYDYMSLSNDMQFAIQQIVSKIDWAEAEKNFTEEGWNGAQAYVDSIIESLSSANDDVTKAITELFNNPELSISQKKEYLNDIVGYYKSNELEIPVVFTLQKDSLNDLNTRVYNSFESLTNEANGINRTEWNSLHEFTKDFTEEQWELWFKVTLGAENATDAIEKYESSLNNVANKSVTFDTTVFSETIDKLSSLQSLYESFKEESEGSIYIPIDITDIEALDDSLKSLSGFREFEEILSSSSSDISDVERAFNQLATEYIHVSGALRGLNTDNRDMIVSQLELKGLYNASSIITSELAEAYEQAAIAGVDLSNATFDEINQLIQSKKVTDDSAEAMIEYFLAKVQAGLATIDTTTDVQQLINEYEQIGLNCELLREYLSLKNQKQREGSTFGLGAGNYQPVGWTPTTNTSNNDFPDDETYEFGASGDKDKKSKSGSSSNDDPWKDAFDKELATLQHNKEMEYITEAEYYAQLQILNEKYFSGKEKYLDDYRKYEEEIYDGLKDVYKKYIEAQIDLLNVQLDNATISYEDYLSKMVDLLNSFYSEGKISAEDYFGYLDDLYSKQLDIRDRVKNTVVNYIKDQIDELEEQKEAIESTYQLQIDALESEKEALEKANEARQDAIDLQKKLYEANRAQYQRDNFVFTSDKGFVYRPDESNIRDAQNDLDDAEYENKIKEIENQISILEQTMESATDGIDDQIDALNEYAEQWNNVSDIHDNAINEIYTAELLGQSWEEEVMGMRQEILKTFTEDYCALQQAQADAAVQAANKIVEANNNIANSQMTSPTTIANSASDVGSSETSGGDTPPDNSKEEPPKRQATGKYYIYDNNGVRRYPQGFNTSGEAWSYLTSKVGTYDAREHYKVLLKYAKGGVVGKYKHPLDAIANAVGEDHLIAAKEGERVLTRKQNENLEKLVNIPDYIIPLKQGDSPLLDKISLSSVLNNRNPFENIGINNIPNLSVSRNNNPIINIQNPVFTCTGVTGEQVLKEIQGQFEGLFINAYQKAMKR